MIRILPFLFLLLLTSCSKNDSYVIFGDLRFVNASKAYLLEQDELGNLVVTDSAAIYGGVFYFKGHVNSPTMKYVQVEKRHPIDVLVENTKIKMTGSILLPDEIKIVGSQSHLDFAYLQREMLKMKAEHNKLLIELTNAKKQNNQTQVKELTQQYNAVSAKFLEFTEHFVAGNPTSVGAAYFVCMLMQHFDVLKLASIITTFDSSIADNQYMRFLNEELALHQKLSIESPAPDFRIPTIAGDTVTLLNFQGQYLFIDFWASWCDRSAERRQHLQKLYDKYSESGFTVLAVSLDREKEAWKTAVSQQKYEWTEASDLLYWESPISKMYRVQKIPYGVLVGPSGEILSINPRRYMLEAKLTNIFGY